MSELQEILDVTDASFPAQVLEQSRQRPVVVDFWAPWCGPCRMLGPVLEKLAREGAGSFVLAKVNVDENPEVAAQFGIQGIPAVKAFKGGEVIDEFVGAQPERSVREFLERISGPSEDDAALAEALLARGETEEARGAFGRALERRPGHPGAILGLAKLNLDDGMPEAALELLAELTPEARAKRGAEVGQLAFAARAQLAGEVGALRKKAEKGDDAAQLGLGWHLAAAGENRAALEQFLDVVTRRHREGAGEEARKAMLELFEALGRDELVGEFRDKLAAQLFR